MDSLTHLALGACIGEIYAGKSLGKKALVVGAVAQSIPDIDFVASFWLSPAADLIAHRGITHSLLFVLLLAYPLAWALKRFRWLSKIGISQLASLLLLQMMVHLFLDAFNAYGTAWFAPFDSSRISFHALFVADPFFSVPLGVTALLLSIWRDNKTSRTKWALSAISISLIYLGYALFNKLSVSNKVENELNRQQISHSRYFTTPTPGNTWLWYAVAEKEDGFHIGYSSVFDSNNTIDFQFFPRNAHALDSISDHESLQHLKQFSEGYYVVSQYEDQLVFNDLRFGQMLGWKDPRSPFVFYYYLEHPNDNELLIQRGRFAKWDIEAVKSFLARIGGR
ncbi:MAG: metal-dependent hydrolase [Cyclobacteriaceae bacterium]